jgi:hypothetical protein
MRPKCAVSQFPLTEKEIPAGVTVMGWNQLS